jgi:hypothetical protein
MTVSLENLRRKRRALASLRFMGDAFFTTVEEICGVLLLKAKRSA